MSLYVTVLREADDKLSAKEWRFWFYDTRGALFLDNYYELERKTARQKYKIVRCYNRIDRRDSDIKREADAPLPDDVVAEAIHKFVFSIKVLSWDKTEAR